MLDYEERVLLMLEAIRQAILAIDPKTSRFDSDQHATKSRELAEVADLPTVRP